MTALSFVQCKTSWRDPGIIPRDLDPDAKRKWVEDADGPGQGAYRVDLRYIRVKEGVVLSKCQSLRGFVTIDDRLTRMNRV